MVTLRGPWRWVQQRWGLSRVLVLIMGYWAAALGASYIFQAESVRERTALYRVLIDYIDPRIWGATIGLAGLLMVGGAFRNRVWIAQIGTLAALAAWSFSTVLYVVDWQRSASQVFIVGIPLWLLFFLTWNATSQRVNRYEQFEDGTINPEVAE